MENNKQKIAVVALVALLVVSAIGVTIAYFTSETVFKNEFKTPAHESEFTEEFSSPENWLPGDEEKKEVSVKNTGEYDIAVRISYTEEWIGADGTTQLPLIQDQDGTEVRAAIINFPNKDDWGKRTESDGVTYYYYKDILGKDESTSLFMDKVTFNKDIRHDEVCTNVYTYKDNTTSTGTSPEEGKIVTSTTKRCESTGQTYAGGTYILTIKIETIQWDQYKNGWGLDEELGDLEWEKTLNSVMKNRAIIDNIKSEFVESESGIKFGEISSNTNGKGIYLRAGTENDEYPIYYYRGEINDNNIIFADFCWKIVRTTETGGIKLIYNGSVGMNNICDNSGEVSQIGISKFNDSSDKNKYLGYMYDVNTSSIVKKYIDNWYENNLKNTDFEKMLEDTVWCNDRKIYRRNVDVGGTFTWDFYDFYGRVAYNHTVSLTCSQQSDKYTLQNISNNFNTNLNGNKLLSYPIALLTADEAVLAGGGNVSGITDISSSTDYSNSKYYLYNSQNYWLLSPLGEVPKYNYSYFTKICSNGSLCPDLVGGSNGVRPSISLKNGIKIVSGNGTSVNPYQIEM